MNNSIQITDSAFKRVLELAKLEQSQLSKLRISVDGGGCSGFVYRYEMVDAVNEEDIVFSQGESVIIIDPISLQYMNDSIVDFVEELGSSYFVIKNPNASAKCGCGNSFSI